MMRVAVVGATGEVGRTMIKVLEEQGVRPEELRFFASERSAGMKLPFCGTEIDVEVLDQSWPFEGHFDYLLLSAGGALSKRFAPVAASRGAVVIDNSSAWRMDPAVPLVVPEINGDMLAGYRGIVANPNCSTIQMVLSLAEIHRRWGLKQIVVSTYQAVSGAGHQGMEELKRQEGGDAECSKFPAPIWRNVVSLIGDADERGFTDEEMKMVNEPRKIFRDESIDVWPTTVRVPVLYGHSESIFVTTCKPWASLAEVRAALEETENVQYSDEVITPRTHSDGSDITWVGRLRSLGEGSFLFWNSADNVRVGAATNAVRILKHHRTLNH